MSSRTGEHQNRFLGMKPGSQDKESLLICTEGLGYIHYLPRPLKGRREQINLEIPYKSECRKFYWIVYFLCDEEESLLFRDHHISPQRIQDMHIIIEVAFYLMK